MTENEVFIVVCMGSIGVTLFLVGILARFGIYRSLFAVKGNPAVAPTVLTYILIPGSLVPFFFALLPFLPISKQDRGDLVISVLIPLLVANYVLAIWQPWWLKPKWLRWLEQEHGDILELLREEVRKDRWGWERRVRTQKDLEEWVAEVRRKHGLEQ